MLILMPANLGPRKASMHLLPTRSSCPLSKRLGDSVALEACVPVPACSCITDRVPQAIIANALKIQSAAYISEIQPLISSSETLGIPKFNNPKFRQHGTTLIPIALDHQLYNLYIKYMQQRLRVLDGLKKLIFNRTDNRETWYEIFLTIFVLLCNLESVPEPNCFRKRNTPVVYVQSSSITQGLASG